MGLIDRDLKKRPVKSGSLEEEGKLGERA